jgi:hypothetical protein
MPWKYIETLGGRLNIDNINILLKYHTAKGIQAVVEQEAKWFSTNYTKPTTVKQHPPAALIHDYISYGVLQSLDFFRPSNLANERCFEC